MLHLRTQSTRSQRRRRILSEDVANVVVFLASEETSAITGAVHLVNAGEFMYLR